MSSEEGKKKGPQPSSGGSEEAKKKTSQPPAAPPEEVKKKSAQPSGAGAQEVKKKKKTRGLSSYYKIEGGTLQRKLKTCPRCGPAVFLAEHYDRFACGKCGYAEFRRKTE